MAQLAYRTLTLTPVETIIEGGNEPKVWTHNVPARGKADYSARAVAILGRMAKALPETIKPSQIVITIKCDDFVSLKSNYGFQIRWPKWEGRKVLANPQSVPEMPDLGPEPEDYDPEAN